MIILATAVALALLAQQNPLPFRGEVQSIDRSSKRITIHNESVPGWMDQMTMPFAVDSDTDFDRIKPGDRITATVYPGDMTLHNVQPVQATSNVALEHFEQLALSANPTIAQARANIRIAAGLVRQSGLYPNPVAGYYGDEIRGGNFAGGKQGGFLSQTIVLGSKLHAAHLTAILRQAETETDAEIQKQRVLTAVRMAFYRVLSAQRLVDVRQRLATLAADALDTSRRFANIGQADRPDVLQAEVESELAALHLANAQSDLDSQWRVLAAIVGQPDMPVTKLEGDLESIPALTLEDSIAAALRDSPEMKRVRQSADRAEASLTQARKAPIPDLQIAANLSQNREPLGTGLPPVGLNGGAQIGVELPLFNRNQGNIEAARGEIESAKQDTARVQLRLRRDLTEVFRDYDIARTGAIRYRDRILPRAQQAYELYQSSYQKMAATWPQVLMSQRTLFQLEADYIQSLDNAWQNSLLIQGFGLTGALDVPEATRHPK